MTLGANPTFVCRDRSGISFAVTIQLSEKGGEEGKFDVKGFKKGYTIVVKGARKFGVRDGKQGSVKTGRDEVEVCFSCFCVGGGKGDNKANGGDRSFRLVGRSCLR